MKGLDLIVDMRRRGFKPAYLAITDCPPMPGVLDDVQFASTDSPEFLDLRVLVGLFVVIQGNDSRLVKRWADAAMKAGALTVIAQAGDVWTHYRVNGEDQ